MYSSIPSIRVPISIHALKEERLITSITRQNNAVVDKVGTQAAGYAARPYFSAKVHHACKYKLLIP